MTEETLPKWKKKALLEVFKIAMQGELAENGQARKFFKLMQKTEKLEKKNELTEAAEQALERKANRLMRDADTISEESEAELASAKAAALAKGLSKEEVDSVAHLLHDAKSFKQIFGDKALPKDMLQSMRKIDKAVVKLGDKPIYAGFYM